MCSVVSNFSDTPRDLGETQPAALCSGDGRRHTSKAVHDLLIDAKYFELIKSGLKTVEGKVNKPKYAHLQNGDVIRFVSTSNPDAQIFCDLVERVHYPNFGEMLQIEGIENCLPGINSIEEGVAVYHSFPDYARDEKLYQVSALKVKCIDEKLLNQDCP